MLGSDPDERQFLTFIHNPICIHIYALRVHTFTRCGEHTFIPCTYTHINKLWMYTRLQAVSVYTFTSCECTHIYKLWVYTHLQAESVHHYTLYVYTQFTHFTCAPIYTLWMYTHFHIVGINTFYAVSVHTYTLWVYTHLHAAHVSIHTFTRCTCTHIYSLCTRCTRTKIDTLCILIDYHPMNNRRKVTNREFVIV